MTALPRITSRIDTQNVKLIADRMGRRHVDTSQVLRLDGWWSSADASRLIESLLMGLPVPSLCVCEDGKLWILLDGRQRINALDWFVNRNGRLTGLEHLTELNGSTFAELSEAFRARLLEAELSVHVLDASTPADVVRTVFARLTDNETQQLNPRYTAA